MINDIRKTFGLPRLYLDQKINKFAQNYSNTQIQQNFLSHIDQLGHSLKDRARAAGFNEVVG